MQTLKTPTQEIHVGYLGENLFQFFFSMLCLSESLLINFT